MERPTPKAAGIVAMMTAIVGIDRMTAMEHGICTMCRSSAVEFRDALSETEYRISGLCQVCQDKVFT
jgi:hypothetical protein